MIFKPHHVAFTVKDTEESTTWYQERLGFNKIHSYNKNGMNIVLLQKGEVRLELFSFDKGLKPLPDERKDLYSDLHTVGTKHLCIEVDNLEEVTHTLHEKGVRFVTELDEAAFGGRYIFIEDCNGILIELYENSLR